MTAPIAMVIVTYQSARTGGRDAETSLAQLDRRRRARGGRQRVHGRRARGRARRRPGAPVRSTATSDSRAAATPARRRPSAPLLLFLNPDAVPAPGCIEALRAAARERPTWGAWQALVTLTGGATVNTSGRRHALPRDGLGRRLRRACRRGAQRPGRGRLRLGRGARVRREPGTRRRLRRAYFMYGEDLDLVLRLWLAGRRRRRARRAGRARLRVRQGRAQVVPARAQPLVDRARATTRRPALPLLPALLAAELALLVVAARGGWLRAKLRAQAAVVRELPQSWPGGAPSRNGARSARRPSPSGSARASITPTSATSRGCRAGCASALYWNAVQGSLRLLRAPARTVTQVAGESCDVAVVGGGILGLAVARELRAGARTAAWSCWSARPRSASTRPATTAASSTPGSTTRPAR